jgi:outer membrane protein assembly factor BamB
MSSRIPYLLILASFAFSGMTAKAGDWPGFRGPTGQGVAPNEAWPLAWSETENITWKIPVPGLAWSSPAIVGDRIFLTTAVETNPAEYALGATCLDRDSGEVIWHKDVFTQQGPVQKHDKNSHASPTPLIEGDRLYIHFGPHGTACLSLEGEVIWQTNELQYEPRHGNGGSPAIAGDLLIICCDGMDQQFVVGVEKATGDIRWRTERNMNPAKGFSFSTPLIIDVNGEQQAVCPGSEAVFAYNPADGAEIWRVRYPEGYSVVPRPAYGAGLVFVCSGYNEATLYAIDPTGSGDVTDTHVRWSENRNIPLNPSPLITDSLLFVVSDNGIATCFDAATGEKHWQERIGGNFSSSPSLANGRIYFQDENGVCSVVAASAEYELLSTNALDPGERTFASFAFSDGAIFLRSEGHLHRIDDQSQTGG